MGHLAHLPLPFDALGGLLGVIDHSGLLKPAEAQ
jgi:hypothetical protein